MILQTDYVFFDKDELPVFTRIFVIIFFDNGCNKNRFSVHLQQVAAEERPDRGGENRIGKPANKCQALKGIFSKKFSEKIEIKKWT